MATISYIKLPRGLQVNSSLRNRPGKTRMYQEFDKNSTGADKLFQLVASVRNFIQLRSPTVSQSLIFLHSNKSQFYFMIRRETLGWGIFMGWGALLISSGESDILGRMWRTRVSRKPNAEVSSGLRWHAPPGRVWNRGPRKCARSPAFWKLQLCFRQGNKKMKQKAKLRVKLSLNTTNSWVFDNIVCFTI